MSPHTKRRWTLAGIVSGCTLVIGSLGMLVNGAISLDHKIGIAHTATDSLFANDSLLNLRMRRVEKALGIKGGKITVQPERQEGLARRVWHLLF